MRQGNAGQLPKIFSLVYTDGADSPVWNAENYKVQSKQFT